MISPLQSHDPSIQSQCCQCYHVVSSVQAMYVCQEKELANICAFVKTCQWHWRVSVQCKQVPTLTAWSHTLTSSRSRILKRGFQGWLWKEARRTYTVEHDSTSVKKMSSLPSGKPHIPVIKQQNPIHKIAVFRWHRGLCAKNVCCLNTLPDNCWFTIVEDDVSVYIGRQRREGFPVKRMS